MTVNIGSKSNDWRAQACSNFPAFPFVIDGVSLTSVEGFVQGTKLPEDHPTRAVAFASFGGAAKKLSKIAEGKLVWWNGKTITFGSSAHHKLIERAIRAKFQQNPSAMLALLCTAGEEITHDLGKPENPNTSLPAKVFCDILTRIREEELGKRKFGWAWPIVWFAMKMLGRI